MTRAERVGQRAFCIPAGTGLALGRRPRRHAQHQGGVPNSGGEARGGGVSGVGDGGGGAACGAFGYGVGGKDGGLRAPELAEVTATIVTFLILFLRRSSARFLALTSSRSTPLASRAASF